MAGAVRADWIAGERNQLGKYELIRRLATGGMAEIYLARAAAIEGFEKRVVLKRILPQHADNQAFIRMFLAEARLAATLHHPNVVQVYDIGEDDGTYFFAMEHVEGVDLRELLRSAHSASRPIPLQHILHFVVGICAGLHYAHDKRDDNGELLDIVHRDVSPSNVLITFDGGVKVVDFGIAKASNVSTTAGTLKGKIPYMSPEQCRSEPLDRRSDVFSIGTLLWELTTGQRLFRGDNELALIGKVARGDVPPPSSVREPYPPGLEPIVLKALAADVEHRYATALELQLALEDFAHEAGLPLSAARAKPFVREVCARRIAQLDDLLGGVGQEAGGDDGLPGPSAKTPGPTPADPKLIDAGTAITQARHTEPTPDAPASIVTQLSPAEQRPRSLGLGLGVVMGAATVAGMGLVGWLVMSGDAPEPRPNAPVSTQPSVKIEPTVAPTRTEPAPTPELVDEPDVEPLEGAGTEQGEASSTTGTTPPPAETPRPRSRARRQRGSSTRPSPAKNKPDPSPRNESEQPWNPKAAPPPGL